MQSILDRINKNDKMNNTDKSDKIDDTHMDDTHMDDTHMDDTHVDKTKHIDISTNPFIIKKNTCDDIKLNYIRKLNAEKNKQVALNIDNKLIKKKNDDYGKAIDSCADLIDIQSNTITKLNNDIGLFMNTNRIWKKNNDELIDEKENLKNKNYDKLIIIIILIILLLCLSGGLIYLIVKNHKLPSLSMTTSTTST